MTNLLPTAGLGAEGFYVFKLIATTPGKNLQAQHQDWADWLFECGLVVYTEKGGWRTTLEGQSLWNNYTSAYQAEYEKHRRY